MLFKDQAQSLVARWESLRDEDDIETLAAQTVVSLTCMREIPSEVLDALDKLLSYESKKRARCIVEVVQYLRSLAEDRESALRSA